MPNSTTLSKFILFADDTTLVQSHTNVSTLLKEARNSLTLVQDWFLSNQLVLNKDKTETMIFSLKHHTLDAKYFNCVKFLGVVLDSKLTWDKHTELVCNNVSRNVFLLRNLVKCVSQATLLVAYHALIHSKLTYAILVWGHSTHSASVFFVQRKAVRIIADLAYSDDCKEAFKKLNILTVPCAYILQCLLYIKEHAGNYTTFENIHSYSTRNKNNLNTEFLRLTKTRNGTSYYAIKFFNVLPNAVQELEIRRFKTVMKSFLLTNAFYTFNEFMLSDFSQIV